MREVLAKLQHRELAFLAVILLAGLLGGVGTGRLTFRWFFRGRKDFLKCVRYLYTPDWVSLSLGEFWRDVGATFRFGIWVVLVVVAAIVSMLLSVPLIEHVAALLPR